MNNEFENNDMLNNEQPLNKEEQNEQSDDSWDITIEECDESDYERIAQTDSDADKSSVSDESTHCYSSPIQGISFEKDEEREVFHTENNIPEFTVTHSASKKPKRKWVKVVALSLVAGIVFGAGFGLSDGYIRKLAMSKIPIGTTNVTLNKAESKEDTPQSDISVIAQECMPSIVAITNKSVSDVMTFFGTYTQESTSSGSGIIIGKNDTELLIVTNYHVVANTKELSVLFSPVESRLEMQAAASGEYELDDGEIPTAIVKGYDSDKDLAVIAVNLEDISEDLLSEIKIATIGDSSKLSPGDQVVAIGNSLGYGQSVTTGIISAVNRSITMESADGSTTVTNTFIQTDAAINQGNSGGALLDMQGNVIGINSVKIATTGVEGMGYAIPISDVESIIDELMVRKTRAVVDENKQGFLGITGSDVSSSTSQMYGIPVGVFVNSVTEGLAADQAGIKKGCVITKFDGYTVTTIAQLQERLRYYKEGEKVSVTVKIPDGTDYKEKDFTVKLSNRSENLPEE